MPSTELVQNSFSQGELGPYMLGRADNKIYEAGAQQLENWIVLPQGGVQRRRGFAYIDSLPNGTNAAQVRLENFNVGATLQYLLVFLNEVVWIYLNDSKVETLTTPWAGSDVLSLRTAQSGNTMIVVHPNYEPYEIQHDPVANTWAATAISFTNINFYRFNTTQTCTPSGTTGSITLTLSGSTDYWTSDHVGVLVRVNWQANNPPSSMPSGVAQITSITSGLVANATVISDLGSTSADAAWTEQAWSAAHGYPVTTTFFQNRLTFGGTRDAPSTIFASKTGDLYNFDDSQTDDNFAFAFTLSTDQNENILDIRAYLQALAIFSNVGEHLMQTQSGAVTPSNVYIAPQTAFGIANIPSLQIEYKIMAVTNNGKEVRSYDFMYYLNRFQETSYTTVAHQLFADGQYPVAMAYLRDYKDTQANFLFIVRQDGQIAVATIDTDKGVLAWSRLTTNGTFYFDTVVRANHGDGISIDTLYVVTERTNGVFIEYLTETENYVDCYFTGTVGSPQTIWAGLTPLENMAVQIVGDGTVQPSQTVSSAGSITLANPVSTLTAGLEYNSIGETMPMVVTMGGQQLRGKPISKEFCTVYVYNTQSLILDGFPVYLRNLGSMLLDQPLPSVTGEERIAIGGQGVILSPTLTFEVTEPLACTLLTLTTEISIGVSR